MATDGARTTLADYAALIKRRRVYVLSILPTSILVAAFLAYALPATYRSSATILVESSSVPTNMVKATQLTYSDSQIELVQRRVMTKGNLVELVAAIDPYPELKNASAAQKAQMIADNTQIERVDPVTLAPLKDSDAFSVHYQNANPARAAAVAEQLADRFLNYNRKTRTERASDTYNFLLAQATELEKSIQTIEGRMAEFKRTHADALPEDQGRNQDALDRSERNVDFVDAQVRLAEQRVSLLSLQLSQTSPTLVGAVQDSRTQIATLRAELAAAEQKYTPDHPDIKRLRRAIAELGTQMSVGVGVNALTPDNPEYLRIAAELEGERTNLAALRVTANRSRADILGYQRRLGVAPNVEREYMQLQRDHESAQAQYGDVQKKLRDADLTKALEVGERGEGFTLIRAPRVSDSPFSPNRLGIILVGFVLGAALAIGAAAFADSSDPTVRSVVDLPTVAGVSTIGAVPIIRNRGDRRRRKLTYSTVAIAYAAAAIVVAATIVRSVERVRSEAAIVEAAQ